MHPLSVASAVRGSTLSERLCHRLMAHHMPMCARRRRIVQALVRGYPSHQYPICPSEARDIGLPVTEMAETTEVSLLALHDLHMHHGRMHRVVDDPLNHRETTMRVVIGSGAGTVALVNDSALEREKLGAEWFERWWHRGWMRLGVPGVPGGAERIGVEL